MASANIGTFRAGARRTAGPMGRPEFIEGRTRSKSEDRVEQPEDEQQGDHDDGEHDEADET
jgi:hypothetical protein